MRDKANKRLHLHLCAVTPGRYPNGFDRRHLFARTEAGSLGLVTTRIGIGSIYLAVDKF